MNWLLGDILEAKSTALVTADASTSIRRAVQLMNDARIGSLPVMSGGRIAGIFTERDVLRRIADRGLDTTLPLSTVMTSPVQCAPRDMPARDAMLLMTRRRHRHLPVVEGDGILTGMVSIGDLMHWATRELEQQVIDLSTFICGPAASVELPPTASGGRVMLHGAR